MSDELADAIEAALDALSDAPDTGVIRSRGGGPTWPTAPWPRRWEWFALTEVSPRPRCPGDPRGVTQTWGTAFTPWGARRAASREMRSMLRRPLHPTVRAGWAMLAVSGLAAGTVYAMSISPAVGAAAFAASAVLIAGLATRVHDTRRRPSTLYALCDTRRTW